MTHTDDTVSVCSVSVLFEANGPGKILKLMRFAQSLAALYLAFQNIARSVRVAFVFFLELGDTKFLFQSRVGSIMTCKDWRKIDSFLIEFYGVRVTKCTTND